MKGGGSSEPQVYQLRALLRGINPLIWRRVLIRDDSTLALLHQVLQVTFGWSDDHLNRFEIRDREYGVYHDGGPDFRDATATVLRDLGLRRQERFLYEYDFGDSWIHDVRLEAVVALEAKRTYPVCVAGNRAAPPEDCGGAAAFMEKRWQFDVIGSGESHDEWEDLIDDVDEDEWENLSHYHPDRFDRRGECPEFCVNGPYFPQEGCHGDQERDYGRAAEGRRPEEGFFL